VLFRSETRGRPFSIPRGPKGDTIGNPKEILKLIEIDKEKNTEESLINLIRKCAEFYLWGYIELLKKKAKKANFKKAYQTAKNCLKEKDAIQDVSLSACIMGSNREEELERCLKSIDGKVDEIIYVDTGSSDNSIKVAEKYGAKTEHFKWIDDFSAARNYSISFATKKWILIIDTDEELIGDPKEAIREGIKNGCDSISFRLADIRDGKEVGEMSSNVRMMRREYCHYELPVHNQITGWAQRYYAGDVTLKHYGYEMTSDERKKRNEQTMKIALKYLEENDSPLMCYNVAVNCMMKRNYGDAIEWFQKAISGKDRLSQDYYLQAHTYLVKIYSLLRETVKMLETARVINELRPNTELFYDLGAFFYQEHNYQEAMKYFDAYLKVYDAHTPSEMFSTALDKKPVVERAMNYMKGVMEWESTRAEGRQSSSQ